jgi:hypothetical protein
VVVERYVATYRFHEVEGDPLSDPFSLPDVPVGDFTEWLTDPGLEARLLADLTDGGVLRFLAGFDEALGQTPCQVTAAGASRRQSDLGPVRLKANDDPPRRMLEPGPYFDPPFLPIRW